MRVEAGADQDGVLRRRGRGWKKNPCILLANYVHGNLRRWLEGEEVCEGTAGDSAVVLLEIREKQSRFQANELLIAKKFCD